MTPLEELLQRSRMMDLFVRVICDTPHASGNERGLIDVLAQWAETCGFEARTDKIGNLGILVPGRGKYTGTKKALLCQCHADMVPNKLETSAHDFDKDPIQVRLTFATWSRSCDLGLKIQGVTTSLPPVFVLTNYESDTNLQIVTNNS
ncbi:MAG: PepD [Parcubacteria group bacterium GW2011_GWC2_39_14]|nr:MAG: PepD [Parcubacteria group bacterium GW2011_GWC2_39_14]KKR54951.1 MAG: PepD [Parcubacteria group bacterium GW2011_GWA2_40_23]